VLGTSFAVWAPAAQAVSVVGDFNSWDGRLNAMRALGSSGIWEIFLPGVAEGAAYKFEILTSEGDLRMKADPLAFRTLLMPRTDSIVHRSNYLWRDAEWMERRRMTQPHAGPMTIYEVHPGSWRLNPVEGNRSLHYRELADELAAYVTDLGFTHVELLPVMEHPFSGSWGYQVTSYFAPTARFGSPDGFKQFVDHLHGAGVGNGEVIVVVRDRDLSNAQESGMEADWFIEEVRARTQHGDFPPLVTTATDGDNGGWFRNTTDGANFWSSFYHDFVERVRAGRSGGIRPTFVDDYLDRHGAHGWVTVEPGAWNTGDHHGTGFVQWTDSSAQRDALARVAQLSEAVHSASHAIGNGDWAAETLEQARWRLLRAETSCNFYWGEAWVERCHNDLDDAAARLDQVL